MSLRTSFTATLGILAAILAFLGPQTERVDAPLTRAEESAYEETSRYSDVVRVISDLQAHSPMIRVETFGRSHEQRALPLMVLADPPVHTPRQAADSGKPIVFVMANIHGGEVEGKEAALRFARRVLTGDLRQLLQKVVLLIAPIYNADGNERISLENRTAQHGPIGGVGVRENSQGLDLNRDYMKAEAPETRALLGLMNRWDPHITVDLHTTNGSHHGYHLTYSVPLNPSIDPTILAYHREKMMPAIQKAVRSKHGFRTYYYGNFSGEGEQRTWRAFIPQPRAGQNYVGFRNRLTILSEAYSYLPFRRRIEVTEALLEEICRYAVAKGAEILNVTRRADEEAVRRVTPARIGVEYELRPLPRPVEILVGEVTKARNPRSGREMTAVVEDRFKPVKMLDYGVYEATRTVPAASVYLIPADSGFRAVIEKLLDHGIAVEELTAPLTAEVDSFLVDQVVRAERPLQGHRTVRLRGGFRAETLTFPVGTLAVRTAQPLGTLAAYLLEPESDDGLVAWNFMDDQVGAGKIYPIPKLMRAVTFPARLIRRDTSASAGRPLLSNPLTKEPSSYEE